jgi:AcrR family transcriptional regulator
MKDGKAKPDSAGSSKARRGRRAEVSRDAWIAAGLTELGRHGEGALRLEQLCARLGITKGSFYWHFNGRDDLVQAMLETWERRDTLALIELVEAEGGGPGEKLRALFRAANSGRVDFAVEQAIRHLGLSSHPVRQMLLRVDARRLEYLADLFAALGQDTARAEALASLYYGLVFGEAMTFRREDRTLREARQAAALETVIAAAIGPEGEKTE